MMAYLSMMAPRIAELHRVLKPTGKYTFQRNHDVILFYSRSTTRSRTFNQLYMETCPFNLKSGSAMPKSYPDTTRKASVYRRK